MTMTIRYPDQIKPFLYLGTPDNSFDHPHLLEIGVRSLLDLRDFSDKKPRRYPLLHIPVKKDGSTKLSMVYDEAFNEIRKAERDGHAILIFCEDGNNVSASIAVAFLMIVHKWNIRRSYSHVQRCRPSIRPCDTYFDQLYKIKLDRDSPIPPIEDEVKVKKELENTPTTMQPPEFTRRNTATCDKEAVDELEAKLNSNAVTSDNHGNGNGNNNNIENDSDNKNINGNPLDVQLGGNESDAAHQSKSSQLSLEDDTLEAAVSQKQQVEDIQGKGKNRDGIPEPGEEGCGSPTCIVL